MLFNPAQKLGVWSAPGRCFRLADSQSPYAWLVVAHLYGDNRGQIFVNQETWRAHQPKAEEECDSSWRWRMIVRRR